MLPTEGEGVDGYVMTMNCIRFVGLVLDSVHNTKSEPYS